MFFRSSLIREMEFRVNFFAKILQNVSWLLFFLLFVVVIYENTDSVAGWNRGEALVLTGTTYLVGTVYNLFCRSTRQVPEQVRRGTLDFVVTRPVDSQFWVSFRRFNFDELGTILMAVGTLVYGVRSAEIQASALQWTAFFWLLLCAIVLYYSLNLALSTLAIWFVRVDNLWVLAETAGDLSRFPPQIFSVPVQRFLLLVVPVILLSAAPTMQLVFGWRPFYVAVGTVWAVAGFLGARAFWRYALRSYTSASS